MGSSDPPHGRGGAQCRSACAAGWLFGPDCATEAGGITAALRRDIGFPSARAGHPSGLAPGFPGG